MIKKALLGAALFAGLGLASGASQAVMLSSAPGGNSYSFNWNQAFGSYALTGNGVLTVSGFGTNQLRIEFTLTNTSPNAGQGGDRLTSFGFGIDPNATSVRFVDAADGGMRRAGFVSNGTLVSNVAGVEICGYSGSNCSGGSNGGIWAGMSDTFTLLLDGAWGNSVNIDPIGVRYQTGSGSTSFSVPPSANVPAPGPLALFLLGIAGLGVRSRFQSSRSTA
jgi:hypothetical protein